jgi:hypothetical protein
MSKRNLLAVVLILLLLLPVVAFLAYSMGESAEREALLKNANLVLQIRNSYPEGQEAKIYINGVLTRTVNLPAHETMTEQIGVTFTGPGQGAFQVWVVPTFGDDDRETVLVSDGQTAIVDLRVG